MLAVSVNVAVQFREFIIDTHGIADIPSEMQSTAFSVDYTKWADIILYEADYVGVLHYAIIQPQCVTEK
jgi:hypothetical protein